MKRIGFVADNPGAGEFLLPVIQKVKIENIAEVLLLAEGKSLEIWQNAGLEVEKVIFDEEIRIIRFAKKVDIIVAGISAQNSLTNGNWSIEDKVSCYAKQRLNIPVIRTQDLWGTGCDGKILTGDVFCVIDSRAEDVLAEHLESNQKIFITGDPRWYKILEEDNLQIRQKTRDEFAILQSQKMMITYLGQPYLESMATFLLLIKKLDEIFKASEKKGGVGVCCFINTFHPRDTRINQEIMNFLENKLTEEARLKHFNVNIIFKHRLDCSTKDLIIASDYVITGFSAGALYAAILSANTEINIIPVCFLLDELIGEKLFAEKGVKKFPLTENGSAVGVYGEYDEKALTATFEKIFFDSEFQEKIFKAQKKNYYLDPNFMATDKIVAIIKEYLS